MGVTYAAAATLSANTIAGSETGVLVTNPNAADGLGFVGIAEPNVIEDNEVGIHLTGGRVQGQVLQRNRIGVTGSGIFGGDSLTTANRLIANDVGANFSGTLQFNRFLNNAVQVRAQDRQLITQNHFSSNTNTAAIVLDKVSRVQIFNNSIYSAGDSIVIRNGSSETEVRGNIVWSESGYALWLDLASQHGFFSDYNTLYHGPNGKLGRYDERDFLDILDWQVDLNQFDAHSTGWTVIDPQAAKPQLKDKHNGDLLAWSQAAGLQHSSPTIARNDARLDVRPSQPFANLLTNPSFENGRAGWVMDPAASIEAGPFAFTGTAYLASADVLVDRASQVIDLVSAGYSAAQLDSLDYTLVYSGRVRAQSRDTHLTRLELTYMNSTGAELGRSVSTSLGADDRWELLGDRELIPSGTRSVRFEFITTQASVSGSSALLDMATVRVLPRDHALNLGADIDATVNPLPVSQTSIALRWPDFYVDWVRDQAHDIRWETLNNVTHAPVRIDLYQDGLHGPELVANIVDSTVDDGLFTWTPLSSAINYGTLGLRLQVSLVGQTIVYDRTVETFSIPENTNTYYLNDQSTLNDEYATATGNNRQTGRTPATPKPNPVSLLRVYTIAPNQTVMVDNGNYFIHQPLIISGAGVRGDDEGFTLTGPSASSRTANIQLALSQQSQALLELDDADSMGLRHLSLVGGNIGLLVRNDSVDLQALNVAVRDQIDDGIRIESESVGARLNGVSATRTGGDGIQVTTQIHEIRNGQFSNNAGTGIYLISAQSVIVEGNVVRENSGDGISLSETTASTSRIGQTDLSLGLGNIVERNAGDGIVADGTILVVGNRSAIGRRSSRLSGWGFATNTAQFHTMWSTIIAPGLMDQRLLVTEFITTPSAFAWPR